MRPERFKQIDELFEAALETDPAERAALLDSACAGDSEMRLEVESLLAAHERASNFIESPAMEIAAKSTAERQLIYEVGRSIGPYQILSLLGAGGMGEVYLALDTRLNRQVALKLLPPEFMRDAGRVRRFEREASAASALNHPNIVTILDIGQSDNAHYIATEYVEGRTLRRLIVDNELKAAQVLSVAAQIAEALAAAHAAGIIHRDIKPENLMLRPDGYVKILDFGIVKLTESSAGPAGGARVVSEAEQTETGAVLGTIAYMSPEQALGRKVDHRTDIFSLGVILYELLTGRHPFRGATSAATFDSILNCTPPPLRAPDVEASPELESIIFRALEKNPALRYQAASDLRAELKRLQRALGSDTSVSGGFQASTERKSSTRSFSNRQVALALISLLVTVMAVSAYFALRRSRPAMGEETPPPANLNFRQFTDQPGLELSPSLSPDGKTMVYAARDADDWNIYWQRVGGGNPRNLTGDSPTDDTQPAFSPDGEHIAFRSERDKGGIFIMGATGESTRRLTDFGYFPAWSPDGREVVFSTENFSDPNIRRPDQSIIWVVNISTGEKRQLTEGKLGDAAQPAWSPTGMRIAYWGKHKGGQRDIWTIPAQGGNPVQATDDAAFDWNPVWSPNGRYIYFASDRGGSMNIWRIPLEEETGRVTGPPEPLTTPSSYAQQVAFSRDGRRMAYVSQVSSTNIFKADFNPYKEAITRQSVAVTQGFRHAADPDLSPDGEWFSYSSQGERQEDIYIVRKDGAESPRKLTDDAYKDRNPRWSPDGTRIVFYSDRSGRYEAWTINPDGSGLRQMTFNEGWGVAYPFWSPDGARLAYNRDGESCTIVDGTKPWNEQTPQRLPNPTDRRLGIFWATSWSPDGSKLGGWANLQEENPGIVIYSFDTGGFERITNFGSNPLWLKDNRRLLFKDQSRLYIVNSETKKVHELLSLSPHRVAGFGLSVDNRLLYYSLATKESDIWLLDIK